MARLPPSIFKLPVDLIRRGFYSDIYFLRAQDVLLRDGRRVEVGYQFFPREDSVIMGLDEAVAILKTCAGHFLDARRTRWQGAWKKLKVYALRDGDRAGRREPILAIIGDPCYFAPLETVLLGVLARGTSAATAVDKVVRAAAGKPVLYFAARFDHFLTQNASGYAALKAGAFSVSSDANAAYAGVKSVGTMPHLLIGCYKGDTAAAALAFDRHMPGGIRRIALVDWDNDCVGTTRRVLEKLISVCFGVDTRDDDASFRRWAPEVIGAGKGKLWGVRFDTSETLRDRSCRGARSYGVCPELVRKARKVFDRWGCRRLKIVVSGGFDERKVRDFERRRVPVDAYGVGSSLMRPRVDITADVVEFEGTHCVKVGRRKGDWSRLARVK